MGQGSHNCSFQGIFFGFCLVTQPIFYKKLFLTSPKTHQLFSRFLLACSQTAAWIQIHDGHLGKWQNEKNLLRSVERTDLLFLALEKPKRGQACVISAPDCTLESRGPDYDFIRGSFMTISQEGVGHPQPPAKRWGQNLGNKDQFLGSSSVELEGSSAQKPRGCQGGRPGHPGGQQSSAKRGSLLKAIQRPLPRG